MLSTTHHGHDRPKTRGWRRFSGGHLTIVILTFAVLLLFPVGAWAAFTVSHVTITDNQGINTANVDAGHHLLVGDGTGALTVDGTVSRRPVPPASPFQFNIDAQIGETFVAGPAPLSTVINVTSLTISIPVNQGQRHIELRAVLQNASATGCAFGGADLTIWHAENLTGNLTASFPTPLQTPKAAGAKMCLSVYNAYGLSNDVPIVSGSGFTGN
jgi:hypothetical protein